MSECFGAVITYPGGKQLGRVASSRRVIGLNVSAKTKKEFEFQTKYFYMKINNNSNDW